MPARPPIRISPSSSQNSIRITEMEMHSTEHSEYLKEGIWQDADIPFLISKNLNFNADSL